MTEDARPEEKEYASKAAMQQALVLSVHWRSILKEQEQEAIDRLLELRALIKQEDTTATELSKRLIVMKEEQS